MVRFGSSGCLWYTETTFVDVLELPRGWCTWGCSMPGFSNWKGAGVRLCSLHSGALSSISLDIKNSWDHIQLRSLKTNISIVSHTNKIQSYMSQAHSLSSRWVGIKLGQQWFVQSRKATPHPCMVISRVHPILQFAGTSKACHPIQGNPLCANPIACQLESLLWVWMPVPHGQNPGLPPTSSFSEEALFLPLDLASSHSDPH